MLEFSYTAKSATGVATNGTIIATSVADARQLLRGDGLFPLSVVQGTHAADGLKAKKSRRSKVKPADLLMLTSQLAIMSKSGVDLADSLKGVAEECDNAILQKSLHQIYDDVASGDSVSAALNKHRHIFGETYVVAIQAGESSGTMTEVLERLAKLLRFEIKLKNSVTAILTYPLILFTVASLVSSALVLFVLPQFAQVFEDLDRPVPGSTQFLIDVSMFARSNFMLISAAMVVLGIVMWRVRRSTKFRQCFDRAVLQMKGIGPAVQSLTSGRLFTLMGTMLQSGIPLLDSLTLCKTATGNSLLKGLFEKLEQDVVNGLGISPSLVSAKCIPSGAAQMISTAERTGRLAEVMETVGEFYEEEGEQQIRQAVKFLEPAIILTMGIFVSFIVMSVMLPLLDVSTVN